MSLYLKFSATAVLIITTALFYSCKNDNGSNIGKKQVFAMIVQGSAALRIDPFVFSGKILQLKKGEKVQILEKSSEKNWVDKSFDYWYRVKDKTGYTGWIYGTNIKILSKESEEAVDTIITDFMVKEYDRLRKNIAGKWWSVNEFGDFTDHCLEIYENNKYKSYWKGRGKVIVGEYNFDFNTNEIIFLQGTSFNGNLDVIRRGQDYILRKEMGDYELRFQKIAIEVSSEPQLNQDKKK